MLQRLYSAFLGISLFCQHTNSVNYLSLSDPSDITQGKQGSERLHDLAKGTQLQKVVGLNSSTALPSGEASLVLLSWDGSCLL